MKVHVGTSGYNYPEWRGTFYPEKCPSKAMFPFYREHFTSVEINYTFYRLPTAKIVEGWRDQATERFTYALKAPRRITHDKRLQDCADLLAVFCENARALGHHLGPLLFQLPPYFRCDTGRLETFLSLVPRDVRTAFEFRHDSWLTDAVYDVLRQHGAALCIADFGDKTTPELATARHGYFRLRDEGYTASDIERWVDVVMAREADWDDAFVYFKHEEEGKGPAFARTFIELASKKGLTLA